MSEKDNNLEISDEIYKKIYKSISNQIYTWRKIDDDLILIDYNSAAIEITEGRIKDYIGINATELYKNQPHILNDLFNCANAKIDIPREMEYKYISTGEEKYLTVIYNFISPDLVLVQTQDITDRKKAEEIIKKEEQEKSIILENIREHIVYQNLDHTIIYLNKAACDSVNKDPEELIGYKCHEIWHNSNNVCENCPVELSFKTKKTERNEMITPDGRVWIVQGNPIHDERGNLIAGVEVTTEVTEQRKMERKLKQSEQKYREAYNSSNLYKDLFTHDINNIFQNILSSIELYNLYRKDPNKKTELEEIENLIVQQILRGTMLVSNVQNLSAIENYESSLFSIEVNEVLKKAINFVRKSFPNKKINIKTESIQNKDFVIANELLQNAFENLLFNAVKHNNNEIIKIDIKFSKDEKDKKKIIKIEFIDNGVGIPDSMKGEIFYREYRDYLKYKLPSGIGLGLLFTKKVIESFNGEIKVEDRIEGDYSQGSNFIIMIPEEK